MSATTAPTTHKPVPKPHTRITLSNGYRAYHPTTPKPLKKTKDQDQDHSPTKKKTVRFLAGHLTIPYSPSTPPSHKTKAKTKSTTKTGKGSGGADAQNETVQRGPRPGSVVVVLRPGSDDGNEEEEEKHHGNVDGGEMGRYVDGPGGVRVWRKEGRWRGSGRVRVLDEPVRDGLALVREGGCWEEEDREDGDGELRVREEGGYTVRVVRNGRKKKGRKGKAAVHTKKTGEEVKKVEEVVELEKMKEADEVKDVENVDDEDEVESLGESVALSEAGSSGSESGDDDELLYDFSREEAEGWVPVMVADEDQKEEDWMSLTGSWVLIGEPKGAC